MPGGRVVNLPPRGVNCGGSANRKIALEGDPVYWDDPVEGNEGEFIYDSNSPQIFVAGRQVILAGHDAEPDDRGNQNPQAAVSSSCGGVRFGGQKPHRIGDPRVTGGVTLLRPEDPNLGRPALR